MSNLTKKLRDIQRPLTWSEHDQNLDALEAGIEEAKTGNDNTSQTLSALDVYAKSTRSQLDAHEVTTTQALASQKSTLESQYQAAITASEEGTQSALDTKATKTEVTQVKSDLEGSIASSKTDITAEYTSAISTQAQTLQDQIDAKADASYLDIQKQEMEASLGRPLEQHEIDALELAARNEINTKATKTELSDAVANLQGAMATQRSEIEADYDGKLNAKATNSRVDTVASDAESARASTEQRLQGNIDDLEANYEDVTELVVEIDGKKYIKNTQTFDVNGRVTGRVTEAGELVTKVREVTDVWSLELPDGRPVLDTDEDGDAQFHGNVNVESLTGALVQEGIYQPNRKMSWDKEHSFGAVLFNLDTSGFSDKGDLVLEVDLPLVTQNAGFRLFVEDQNRNLLYKEYINPDEQGIDGDAATSRWGEQAGSPFFGYYTKYTYNFTNEPYFHTVIPQEERETRSYKTYWRVPQGTKRLWFNLEPLIPSEGGTVDADFYDYITVKLRKPTVANTPTVSFENGYDNYEIAQQVYRHYRNVLVTTDSAKELSSNSNSMTISHEKVEVSSSNKYTKITIYHGTGKQAKVWKSALTGNGVDEVIEDGIYVMLPDDRYTNRDTSWFARYGHDSFKLIEEESDENVIVIRAFTDGISHQGLFGIVSGNNDYYSGNPFLITLCEITNEVSP